MDLDQFLNQKKDELKENKTIYLQIKVKAASAKNEFVELLNDTENTIKIRIKAIADKGKANTEIMKFIGKFFNGTCEIISGQTHSVKLLKISI